MNDVFIPQKIIGTSIMKIYIYNRWGNLIHYKENPSILWDGTIKSNKALDGTYFWVIEAINSKGNKISKKGIITLLR